ncbi:MAG: glycosyltransferase [Armatimonadota bacterium]|nr:glycosyltransferase [Armatimonadota bacterium]
MHASHRTKFTVIIPTRERCDTLQSTLRTCVDQDYDNLQILVSDNFSQDQTREVVDSFRDDRIRYVNTGKRVSMSHNWEFALSHVDDGYITFIGDDDGLLPGCLTELDDLIRELNCEAIVWHSAAYKWPNYITESLRNKLTIPLDMSLQKCDSATMLHKAGKSLQWAQLPSFYNSVVSYNSSRNVMQETGQFFQSMIPDVYSAIALASVMETYYYSARPYSILGASQHSGGNSMVYGAADGLKAAQRFLSEDNIPFHKMLVYAPSLRLLMAECLLQAHDHLATVRRLNLDIDIKHVLNAVVKEAATQPPLQRDQIIEAVEKMGRLHQIEDYVARLIAEHPPVAVPDAPAPLGIYWDCHAMFLDCADFDVHDVAGACVLCKHALTFARLGYFSPLGILKTTVERGNRKLMPRRTRPQVAEARSKS